MALTWNIAPRGKSKHTAQHKIPPRRLSNFSNFFTLVGFESNFGRFFSGSSALMSSIDCCDDDDGIEIVAVVDCSTDDGERFSTRISAVIKFEYELVEGKVAIWDVATLSVILSTFFSDQRNWTLHFNLTQIYRTLRSITKGWVSCSTLKNSKFFSPKSLKNKIGSTLKSDFVKRLTR